MDKVPSSNSSRKIGGLASTHVARPPHSRPASALASAHPHTWANQLVVLAGDTDMLSVQVAYTEYCNWAAALGQPAFTAPTFGKALRSWFKGITGRAMVQKRKGAGGKNGMAYFGILLRSSSSSLSASTPSSSFSPVSDGSSPATSISASASQTQGAFILPPSSASSSYSFAQPSMASQTPQIVQQAQSLEEEGVDILEDSEYEYVLEEDHTSDGYF